MKKLAQNTLVINQPKFNKTRKSQLDTTAETLGLIENLKISQQNVSGKEDNISIGVVKSLNIALTIKNDLFHEKCVEFYEYVRTTESVTQNTDTFYSKVKEKPFNLLAPKTEIAYFPRRDE